MTNEELLKVIARAKASGATMLNLRDNGLTDLPPELFQLTTLKRLDLDKNQLTTLPSEISQLKNLQELYLCENKFSVLPQALFQLANLTTLDLSVNQCTSLPSKISQLTRLTKLYLDKNLLAVLPSELFHLTRLTVLFLNDNQLAVLPHEICQLTNLTELALVGNHLTSLPIELFQLANLIKLNLYSNKINGLPSEISCLTCLTKLDLGDNQLATLPLELFQLANLRELNLSFNRFNILPSEICKLTKLKHLALYHTPLTSPPYEIAIKGIKAIRQYFAELEKSKQPLNEVKVLLIGDGAAGKTSLVKQLFGQPFDKNEDTTHGINIQGWEQEVGGRKIRINLWDFGGQEIQHATHQFFLSKRSLYVLVLDGRKDERTEYWLRHVEAFGGSSPVLVVLNKMDSNPSFDLNRPFLLEKYPGIRDFFRISCKTGKGVAEFKAALLEELNKVEMIGTVWPGSWFAVKRRLEQMDRPYISAAEYGGFCQEAGITEEQSRETLVDFLHDLGVAVHFREFLLDAMHVLDPVWVTEAVYKIITAESMADKQGCLHLNDVGAILPDCCQGKHCFPPDTHPYILRLMEKFELCYPVSKDAVLIPQLLSVQEPQLAFEQGGALRFALHYPDFLPPSVFPRFMVKVHKDIHENTCWRTGVLLEDKRSGAQALVKADIEARRINIWAQGERRREYLHYLRYTLADINSSFEKLTVSERVPMPDDPQVSADYETLLNLSEAGSDIFIPDGSKTRYSVHKLLGLVQPKSKDELTELMRKVSAHLDEKESGTEVAASLFELKPNIIGIGFNLNELFARILAWAKQRQRASRN